MAKRDTPSEADIRDWVGDPSFARARRYTGDGSLFNLRRQGETIKAHCLGSAPQPYRVEVTLDMGEIVSDDCSCPVGGRCKHVAALLLTWSEDPDRFGEAQDLSVALNTRSKEELITLITQMIRRYPDLETLLDLPIPGGTAQNQPLDPKVIERQVDQLFSGLDYEYGAAYGAADQLSEIADLGRQYAAAGDWRNAAVVYHTVAQGVFDHMDFDDDGALGSVAIDCVAALGEALDAVTEPTLREVILRYLFELYQADVTAGGYGISDEAPDLLLTHATTAEKAMLAQIVRSALSQAGRDHSNWYARPMGGLLLALEEETLDDESYLRICRETGQTYNLIERLLSRDRIEEAVQAAQALGDYELLGVEPAFRVHDQLARFAGLVAARKPAAQDRQLRSWLRNYAQQQGNLDQALALSQEIFWVMPDLEEYRRIQLLATQLGRWPTLQRDLLTRLSEAPQYHELLTRIYLQAGEIDKAIALVRQLREPAGWYRFSGVSLLLLEVARAAEETRPQSAINLYRQIVEQLIGDRKRDSYASAASYLQTMRPLYQRLNQLADWHKLVDDIRQQNPRLRALHDELDKAGL
jgi:hypothetical protein